MSSLTARGVSPSPQTFSRGKYAFSRRSDVEPGGGEVCRGRRPGGPGADDDDVGPAGRSGAGGGAHGAGVAVGGVAADGGGARVHGGLVHGGLSCLACAGVHESQAESMTGRAVRRPRVQPSVRRRAWPGPVRPRRPVQGDDPAGEVAPLDVAPPGGGDALGELPLRRPRLDRLGEVDVGLGVARRPDGRWRAGTDEVLAVDLPEGRVDRLAELAEDEPAARAWSPGGTRASAASGSATLRRPNDIVTTSKAAVGEGQPHRVGRGEAEVGAAPVPDARSIPEREVGRHDVDAAVGERLARRARCPRRCRGRLSPLAPRTPR